jgi:SNF2 family DNA or RNA helicase
MQITAPRYHYVPEHYQEYTTQYIIENLKCGAFLEMGLGKTVSTLTAIDQLFFRHFDLNRVLVVAPKLVARDTWPQEIEKWEHLHRLTYSCLVHKDEKKRIKALNTKAHIHIINYDNLCWLIAQLGGWWPYDMVIFDESSRLKNHASKRFKAIKEVMPFTERVVLLTGTPMGNGYIDLWSQIYLLDKGHRLGVNISTYRNDFFKKAYSGWGYTIRGKKYAKVITDRIADICVSMKQKDYLSLPDRIERSLRVRMPDTLLQQYKQFEKERVLEMVEKEERITAVNAAVLTNKLLQFANGAVYYDVVEGVDELTGKAKIRRETHEIHDLKIEALAEILESANGHSVLCAYQFESDKQRIKKYLSRYAPVFIDDERNFVKNWNAGEIDFGCAHPASAGHGLNLQAGGHIIVFFGHNWSSELRKQFIARLERKGQTESVIVTDIILAGTIDERVIERQKEKESDEDFLLEQVRALIAEHGGSKANRLLASIPDKPKYSFL